MDLYAEMKANTKRGGIPPLLPRILSELSPEDAAMVRKACADTSISDRAIAEVLTAHGHPISYGAVRNSRLSV